MTPPARVWCRGKSASFHSCRPCRYGAGFTTRYVTLKAASSGRSVTCCEKSMFENRPNMRAFQGPSNRLNSIQRATVAEPSSPRTTRQDAGWSGRRMPCSL
jgi:hypothetical protein